MTGSYCSFFENVIILKSKNVTGRYLKKKLNKKIKMRQVHNNSLKTNNNSFFENGIVLKSKYVTGRYY